jgi:hypothetical protein
MTDAIWALKEKEKGWSVNLPYIDALWRVRGTLALDPLLPSAQVFARLDDLFQTTGTSFHVSQTHLLFTKKAPSAQDKMSIYDRGELQIVEREAGRCLAYDLHSNTLIFCLAMPLFFAALSWLIKDSQTAALVFTGLFAALYIIGRILEPKLIRAAFSQRLTSDTSVMDAEAA